MNRTAATRSRRAALASMHPLQAGLERAAVRGAGQGVALGEVLDLAQQHGVAEVERGHAGRLRHDAHDPPLDARRPARVLEHHRADRPAVGDHRGDDDPSRVGHRRRRATGATTGSRRRRAIGARFAQARSRIGSVVERSTCGATPIHAVRARAPRRPSSATPSTRPRGNAYRSTSPSSTNDAWRIGSPSSSSRVPIATSDSRSTRRWRSSRSFIALNSDVASANSQNAVTLTTGSAVRRSERRAGRRPAAASRRPARRSRRTAAASPRARS